MSTSTMSPRLKALQERSEVEAKKARDIAQKALDENRDMTDDEKADYGTSTMSVSVFIDVPSSGGGR